MSEAIRLIIIHGAYGAPDTNWYPWLADEARGFGATAIVPRFPTPEGQDLAGWLGVFDAAAGGSEARTVLLGFSVGAALVVQLARRTSVPYRAAFLVSGVWGALGIPQFDTVNASFFAAPDFTEPDLAEPVFAEPDWARCRRGAAAWHCFAGSDDPYVPEALSQALARHLGIERTVVPGGKHLDAATAGMTTFPALLDKLRPLLASARGTS